METRRRGVARRSSRPSSSSLAARETSRASLHLFVRPRFEPATSSTVSRALSRLTASTPTSTLWSARAEGCAPWPPVSFPPVAAPSRAPPREADASNARRMESAPSLVRPPRASSPRAPRAVPSRLCFEASGPVARRPRPRNIPCPPRRASFEAPPSKSPPPRLVVVGSNPIIDVFADPPAVRRRRPRKRTRTRRRPRRRPISPPISTARPRRSESGDEIRGFGRRHTRHLPFASPSVRATRRRRAWWRLSFSAAASAASFAGRRRRIRPISAAASSYSRSASFASRSAARRASSIARSRAVSPIARRVKTRSLARISSTVRAAVSASSVATRRPAVSTSCARDVRSTVRVRFAEGTRVSIRSP